MSHVEEAGINAGQRAKGWGRERHQITWGPYSAGRRFHGTEQGPAFSPDGRWIAYSSNETGRPEIYVAPYPGPGGKIAISSNGGRSPRWSSNGRELFYRKQPSDDGVAVVPGPTLSIGIPRLLFEGDYVEEQTGQGAHNYDVAGDGRRFMMMAPAPQKERESAPPQIVVVQNWFEELKRLVPVN